MKRKKLILMLLIPGILIFSGCNEQQKETGSEVVATVPEDMNLTMQEIVEVNRPEQILNTMENVSIEDRDSFRYLDNEKYYEDIDGKRLMFAGDYSYMESEDENITWLEFDDTKLDYEDIDNLYFMGELVQHEEITGYKEEEDELHISTKIPKEKVQEFGFGLKELEEGQSFENEYVLDRETYLLRKVINKKCVEGKKAEVIKDLSIAYNVKEPEAVRDTYTLIQNDDQMRNITVVLDPGSLTEQTFCRRVPKGCAIYMDLPDDYYETYTDKEMTMNFNDDVDHDSDLHLYTRKLLRVNC